MPEMALEPAGLDELLATPHIPGLSDGDQRILAARCWGYSNSELAALMGYDAPEALRCRFERIEDIILGPTGLKLALLPAGSLSK